MAERIENSIRLQRSRYSLKGNNAELPESEQNFQFAMNCNGYYLDENGNWVFVPGRNREITKEFKGQEVSFYGPISTNASAFYSIREIGSGELFSNVLRPQVITDCIRKYRLLDENQAARIAYIFGGLIRDIAYAPHPSVSLLDKASEAVSYAAKMTKLGEKSSGDAIASAIAMYILSGGSLEEDKIFEGNIFAMSDAIREDTTKPKTTQDLGLSQLTRLRGFENKTKGGEHKPQVDITEDLEYLRNFPTVGAEFHFPSNIPGKKSEFWKKLAILNMSQYQRGSFIQLARNDRGLIEVRMNPSLYPITIANWKYMSSCLPELEDTYFTLTLNQHSRKNFKWKDEMDNVLLEKLRAIGMLSYAIAYDSVPKNGDPAEIDFGTIYLGQTVKLFSGDFNYTGCWNNKASDHGQLGVYAGFGNNLPYLAYYLSMVMSKPRILSHFSSDLITNTKTLQDALAICQADNKAVFSSLQNRIESTRRLNQAYQAGNRIMEQLLP